jgi:hypothetical protein
MLIEMALKPYKSMDEATFRLLLSNTLPKGIQLSGLSIQAVLLKFNACSCMQIHLFYNQYID